VRLDNRGVMRLRPESQDGEVILTHAWRSTLV
jgi:hypothetical protein